MKAETEEESRIREERQNLRARTREFALGAIKLFSALPSSMPAQVIGKQVLRSATSVGANYREACRARSDQGSSPNRAIVSKNWTRAPIGSYS